MQDKNPPHPNRPTSTLRSKSSDSTSIRGIVKDYFDKTPRATAKILCLDMDLSYEIHGAYINNLLSEFRRKALMSITVRVPHLNHRNKFVWHLPDWDTYKDILPYAKKWKFTAHNKLWSFKDKLGSILWHNTGRVEMLLKGEENIVKAKTLFAHAFFDLIGDMRELDATFPEGNIETKHHEFKIGEKLPQFNIGYFTNSHGLTIYVDGSHPESIEVREERPFWLGELHQIKNSVERTGKQFSVDMDRHMKIIHKSTKLIDKLKKEVEDRKPRFLGKLLRWFW